MTRYTVNVATTPDEFEQIHALNYRTFVEEVPQHHPNPDRRLVDRFHAENTYVVCKVDDVVIGMVCVRDRRPFSVDEKLGPFEDHLPPDVARPERPCEIRLLAIDPGHRGVRVIFGLLSHLLRLALERGYDFALMSGRPANMTIYRALGFRPFGPITGSEEAPYQPMYASAELFAMAQSRGRLVAALPEVLARTLPTRRPRPAGRPARSSREGAVERRAWLEERRAAVEEDYTRTAGTYDVDDTPITATHRRFVERLLATCPPGGIVLDAPCGTGKYFGIIREAGRRVVGLDQSTGMLAQAEAKGLAERLDLGGLQELELVAEFDGSMTVDAMENVPPDDWPTVLANLHRAVRPGGHIYLTVEEIDEAEIEAAFTELTGRGLPVVRGEVIEGDVAGYHYYPGRQRVERWFADEGLVVVDEAFNQEDHWEGWGYRHYLVRDPGDRPRQDPPTEEVAVMADDLDPREAERVRRRDREAAAEQRDLMKPGMGKVFKQIQDTQAKAAKVPPKRRAKAGGKAKGKLRG